MYCNQCGSLNSDDANFCINCGRELASTDTPEAPEVLEASSGRQAKGELHGVGGWLLLLIFVLTLIYPSSSYYAITEEFAAMQGQYPQLASAEWWASYKNLTSVVGIGSAILSVTAGLTLYTSQKRGAVAFAVVVLFLINPGVGLADALVVALTLPNMTLADSLSDSWSTLVPQAGAAVLWTLYLFNSQRVRNTYTI